MNTLSELKALIQATFDIDPSTIAGLAQHIDVLRQPQPA